MRQSRAIYAVMFALLLVTTVCSVNATIVRTIISPKLDGNNPVEPAVGMFLIARRSLHGSYFQRSVIYLVKHSEQGTLGLIVNRPTSLQLTEDVANIGDKTGQSYPLYLGGPVERKQVLMLLRNPPDLPLIKHVADNVYFSVSRNVLEHLFEIDKPRNDLRLYIGHSGWIPGQLDFELANKRWHLVRAETETIFSHDTESLWERLINHFEPTGIYVDRR